MVSYLLGRHQAQAVSAPSIGNTQEPGSANRPFDYTVYNDGASWLATDNRAGGNKFSRSNISAVLQAIADEGSRSVFLKDSGAITPAVSIGANNTLSIESDGTRTITATASPAFTFGSGASLVLSLVRLTDATAGFTNDLFVYNELTAYPSTGPAFEATVRLRDDDLGRRIAITTSKAFGIEVVQTGSNNDGFAGYNKAEGGVAYYAEITADSSAVTNATAYRTEMRKAGLTNPIAHDVADIEGTGKGFKYASSKAGGLGSEISNTHQASPNAGFTGQTIIDNQQSGAANNAGSDIRQYQDNLDAWVLYDLQRANAKSFQSGKNAGGGYHRVNNASGTERARLQPGSSGNRGAVKLYDATLAAFRWVYIDNGAWVISATEPT